MGPAWHVHSRLFEVFARNTAAVHAFLIEVRIYQFSASFNAETMHHEFETRVHAYIAVAVVAKQQAYGAAYPGRLFRRDESVQGLRCKGLPPHASADIHTESVFNIALAVLTRYGHKTDTVDIGLATIAATTGKGNFEFSG